MCLRFPRHHPRSDCEFSSHKSQHHQFGLQRNVKYSITQLQNIITLITSYLTSVIKHPLPIPIHLHQVSTQDPPISAKRTNYLQLPSYQSPRHLQYVSLSSRPHLRSILQAVPILVGATLTRSCGPSPTTMASDIDCLQHHKGGSKAGQRTPK